MAETLFTTTTENLDKARFEEVFKIFDKNNNGVLSLSEIYGAVMKLYPHLAENKSAIMQAYKSADISKDGLVDFKEFERLIYHLNYDELLMICKKIDKNNDNLINFVEFKKGLALMGLIVSSDRKLKEKFDEIDANNDGYITFNEFCTYGTKIKLIPNIPQDDQDAKDAQVTLETQETQNTQKTRKSRKNKLRILTKLIDFILVKIKKFSSVLLTEKPGDRLLVHEQHYTSSPHVTATN
ncbi:hypothetical protein C1645_808974 [Glomus cerebriforme]|uniref:EF-hand domain-containing protein n=1 Tax=Glomus cerebriforme TaxID=658196 RepID=A0A397SDE5_9GLOM|nr:hypothetical protein C1645_808974 [Glomus cerebriforme]